MAVPEQQHEKIPRKLAMISKAPHSGRGMWKYMLKWVCCFSWMSDDEGTQGN